MSMGVTDFIVAGPPGQITAGPAGSFQASPPGQISIGEPGHVPIDATPARVPIDTSIARIPYSAATGGGLASAFAGAASAGGGGMTAGMSSSHIGGGGGGGGTVGSATGIGSTGRTGSDNSISQSTSGGFAVSGGANVPISTEAGKPNISPATGGTSGQSGPGNGVGQGTSGGFAVSGGANVPISTEGGRTNAAPATGGNPSGPVGGSPVEHPGSPPTLATGNVTITPALGVQPISPAGSVQIAPQIGFSMPTLTGFVPITPGGTIMAQRMTNPHGMFFGHTQHWPNDVFHHSRHSSPYVPPTVPMAPWVPTADGYAEPFSTPKTDFDQDMGRGAPVDMRSEYSMNIDQTQDIEQNRQVTYNETVDQTLDQSMNQVVERNDRSLTQNEFDNSTHRSLDLSTHPTTQNIEKVTQNFNRDNQFSNVTNISNEQDNSRSFTNQESHHTTLATENTDIRNVDASQSTTENPTYVFDNSSRSFLNFAAPERTGGDIVVGNA
jgi:hypothetical protein